MMNNVRRKICQYALSAPWLNSISACAQPAKQPPQRIYSEEEKQRLHKFREIRGVEWYLSFVHEVNYVEVRDQDDQFIDAVSVGSPNTDRKKGMKGIPGYLKVTWRNDEPQNPISSGTRNQFWSGGKIVANFEIPVADRIPDNLLDDLRRDPKGTLRIKIRLHREGVLLGWDIQRRPGYDPQKRDQWGSAVYVGPVHSFAGGDFREAEIFNGKAVRKGWYIHPRTGQKIETDF